MRSISRRHGKSPMANTASVGAGGGGRGVQQMVYDRSVRDEGSDFSVWPVGYVAGTALFEFSDEPQEENLVTQALFGVQEHTLSAKVGSAPRRRSVWTLSTAFT